MAKYNMANIPILFSDYDDRVDRDYAEMRQQFGVEIGKIEKEMARYQSGLLNQEGRLVSSLMSSGAASPSSHARKTDDNATIRPISPPIIQNNGKQKVMKLRFDVSDYPLNEVDVRANNKTLEIHAKYKHKIGNKTISRESKREVTLPEGVQPEYIRPTISRNGVLTVNAPLPNRRRPRSSSRFRQQVQQEHMQLQQQQPQQRMR